MKLASFAAVLAVAGTLGIAAAAEAASVLQLDGKRVHKIEDPYANTSDVPMLDAALGSRPLVDRPTLPPPVHIAASKTVGSELQRLRSAGAISDDEYRDYRKIYADARQMRGKLSGSRRVQLGSVIYNLERFAAQGGLTATRSAPLFLTLKRNREWWANGRMLVYGERVNFKGSELIWQFYPGQGIQLMWLANFGRANAYWSVKKKDDNLRKLLDEVLSLAVKRGNGIAWEGYFEFDGGKPGWVSGLWQGTGIQAFARAGVKLGKNEPEHVDPVTNKEIRAIPEYLQASYRALDIFKRRSPAGVRIPMGNNSAHYLIYSFYPSLRVLNAFIQSLNGLHDLYELAGYREALELFNQGDRRARIETPRYDTGAWSLYSQYRESDLSYHTLLRDFLKGLCSRTKTTVYCTTATHFTTYLKQAPALKLLSTSARTRRTSTLSFRLSKISSVQVTVSRGGAVVFSRSEQLGYGTKNYSWSPNRSGPYAVRISATDLAGNRGSTSGTITAR